MAAKEKHIHKLRRHKYKSGNTVYFCMLPDCNFKINTALALGKMCICHRCGEPFQMNDYSIRLAKPHCPNCHKPKGQPDIIEPENIDWGRSEPATEVTDLRARLTKAVHSPIMGEPDDEGEI